MSNLDTIIIKHKFSLFSTKSDVLKKSNWNHFFLIEVQMRHFKRLLRYISIIKLYACMSWKLLLFLTLYGIHHVMIEKYYK